MRIVIVFCLFGLAAVAYPTPIAGTYFSRFDNIDVDEFINNRRLFSSYIKCMLDLGKCTRQGKELKSRIKQSIEEECDQCTPALRSRIRRIVAHLINHEPNFWNQLKAKYDSTGKYAAKYENELKELTA